MNRMIFFLLLTLSPCRVGTLFAQATDNTGTERQVSSDSYIRINYSNDYFTATDYYLTQAIQLEAVLPVFSTVPAYKALFKIPGSERKYGMSLEHNAYTPVHYSREEIQYGDRPFAACLLLNMFAISNDSARHQRLRSGISAGVIGRSAFGEDMQTFIHEHTHNALPYGWRNQIHNDVVLNYNIAYQKQLLAVPDLMSLTADAVLRMGTLSTKGNIGITLMAGYFDNPFASFYIRRKKLQLYAYDHPEINAVGYDATLQGGLFNHSSPYTIAASDVSRFVFRNNWGVVMQWGRVYLEYYQSYMTKEFDSGMAFHNGGIQIGYSF